MTISTIDESQRKAAKVAGFTCLFTMATVVFANFGIHSRLIVILKPVDRGLALLAAFWRLVYALMWVLMTLNLFEALRLLSGADYLRVFEAERLQALARLYLGGRFDVYYVGLVFYALASTVCSYLWFKSNFIPRALAAWGVVSSAFCAACTFVFIIFPDFAKVVNLWWFDSPMGIFEMATSFWLLFKGLSPSELAAPDHAQAGAAV